jgi:phosphocarrier protein
MLTKEVIVKSAAGLHARPATALMKTAYKFKSKIEIEYKGEKINAKTLIGILSLGVGTGEKVKLIISGDDEIKAMEDVKNVIENAQ